MVPMPDESAVFSKPVIHPKITGLESLDSGEAQLVDMTKRTGRKLSEAPPKVEPRKAKVNVDLDTFDQSGSGETIDVPRSDSDTDSTYYLHWLATLERMVGERGLADAATLDRYHQAWARAASRTPHGSPIELKGVDFLA